MKKHGMLEKMLCDDLIIIDECSMVDMHLFTSLMMKIKTGSRIVFVGDKDQLESVGPGNVFKELIDSRVIPVTVLDQCFRQETLLFGECDKNQLWQTKFGI